MELKNEHRKLSVAMAVVMDRSGSMSMSAGGGKSKMDLAILALPLPAKYLEVESLFDEELLLVFVCGHVAGRVLDFLEVLEELVVP